MEMGETYMLNKQNKHVQKTGKSNTSAAFKVGGIFNARSFQSMSLFKKPAKELPPLFTEAELSGATYEQVMDFLVSVNDDDYSKIMKVADLYRKNHADVAEVTGLKYEVPPSIFEQQTIAARPAAAADTEAGNFLDDDDELAAAFLDDDEPTAPAKPTKVDVKTDDGPVAS